MGRGPREVSSVVAGGSQAGLTEREYDVIVVGSGAAGGAAARALTRRGLDVLMLEAGPVVEPSGIDGEDGVSMARRLWRHFVTRRQGVQEQHPGYWSYSPDLFVDDRENPYSVDGGSRVVWVRGRQLGGRTLTWGGVTLRMSERDLQGPYQDGYGPEWPLRYSDLEPYYSEIEGYLGVRGAAAGLSQLPDGNFSDPSRLTGAEERLRVAVEARWSERRVLPCRGISGTGDGGWPQKSSPATFLREALASGHLTLETDAVVSKLLVSSSGRAVEGVEWRDRLTGRLRTSRARSVALGASSLESVRLMLNSRGPAHPAGIGNSHDLLGRYLMDHISVTTHIVMPDDGSGTSGFDAPGSILCPRFVNLEKTELDFSGGYGIWGCIQRDSIPTVGPAGTVSGFLVAHGEMVPRAESRMSIDPVRVDRWGIPVPRFQCGWSENEWRMARHMKASLKEIVEEAGGECANIADMMENKAGRFVYQRSVGKAYPESMAPSAFGSYVHEVGGARMGNEPKASVLDPYSCCWEVDNLVVVDGACFPSSGWQGPTLTIMALATRASERLAERLESGDLVRA